MYLSFYNLREQPFRLTPDPKFLHLAEPHRNTLVALAEVTHQRKGFLVMTGPIGTGKTTLLNTFLRILATKFPAPERKVVSAIIQNPLLKRDEFLEAVMDEFEVPCPSQSKAKRLVALHELFLRTNLQGGTAVLIIDEAHLLSIELLEEIRLLGNLETEKGKLVQIVLCGQPEFASVLLQPQLRALRQRIALVTQLRPLNVTETHAYIQERLRWAGLRAASPFTAFAMDRIYQRTHGVPRLINLLCDGCLSMGHKVQQRQFGPEIVEAAASRLLMSEALAGTPQNGSGAYQKSQSDASLVVPAAMKRTGELGKKDEPVL